MRKALPLILLTTLTTASAEIDCGTPVLRFFEVLHYSEKAKFPDPPKKVQVNVWKLKKPLDICTVMFSVKDNVLRIKADKLDYLGYLTTSGRQGGGVTLSGMTPGLFGRTGIDIDLTLRNLYTTYSAQVSVPREMAASTAIAMRVDGGKLQPLFWPGVVTPDVNFPKTTKILEFYVKSDLKTNWERVTLNLKNPELVVYRKYPFPKK